MPLYWFVKEMPKVPVRFTKATPPPCYLVGPMRVKVNGQEADLENGMNLENLIVFYRLKRDQVVVELNRKVPAKDAYATTFLKDGDEVEIVKFLGGG